jgi:hypothetical protein
VALIAVGAIVGIAISGQKSSSSSSSGDNESSSKPQANPLNLRLSSVHDGDVVHRDVITINGTVTPGATVRIDDRAAKVSGQHFSRKVRLHHGANYIVLSAQAPGYQSVEESISIDRKLTGAQRAAIRERIRQRMEARKQAFMTSAITVPYKQLSKNADNFAGKKVTYHGQIFQVQEDAGQSVILLSVTDQGYGFWDDNIWVDYNGTIKGGKGDMLTIYGKVTGTKTYETQIGGQTYVPEVRAKYVAEG